MRSVAVLSVKVTVIRLLTRLWFFEAISESETSNLVIRLLLATWFREMSEMSCLVILRSSFLVDKSGTSRSMVHDSYDGVLDVSELAEELLLESDEELPLDESPFIDSDSVQKDVSDDDISHFSDSSMDIRYPRKPLALMIAFCS